MGRRGKKVAESAVTGMEWDTRAFPPHADRWRYRNIAHVKQWVRNKKGVREGQQGSKEDVDLKIKR